MSKTKGAIKGSSCSCKMMGTTIERGLYAFERGFVAAACTLIGILFSHTRGMAKPLEEVGPLYFLPLLLVFFGAALSNGFYSRASACFPEEHGATLFAPVLVVLLAAAADSRLGEFCQGSWARVNTFLVIWLYALLQLTVILISLRPRIFWRLRRSIGPNRLRYALVLPALLTEIMGMLLGVSLPLALAGIPLGAAPLLAGMVYVAVWFLTRGLDRFRYRDVHCGIFLGFCLAGVALFASFYWLKISIPDSIFLPAKGLFVGVLAGTYLAILGGYFRTQMQQKTWRKAGRHHERCVRERRAFLGLLVYFYEPLVFLTYISVRLSVVYLLCYAVGNAILFRHMQRERVHVRLAHGIFLTAAIVTLFLEFGAILPPSVYRISLGSESSAGVATVIIGNALSFLSNKPPERERRGRSGDKSGQDASRKQKVPPLFGVIYQCQFREARLLTLGFMQMLVAIGAALFGYTERVQACLLVSGVSIIIEAFCETMARNIDLKQRSREDDDNRTAA